MKTVPKISCCMMVKDEEKDIRRCLESIKGHVDEIIVVDTGSTDRTVELVSEYTDKIYHHPWENDFSKHRNQSISYASGDWILILDADEELVNGQDLKRAVLDGEMDSIGFNVYDFSGKGELIAVSNSARMFRSGLGIHYEGIVHNKLTGFKHVKITELNINHYGYQQNSEMDHKKFLRTSALLKKQIESDPDNPLLHLYLSSSYYMVEKEDECLKEALKAIDLIEVQDIRIKEYIRAYSNAARILIQNKGRLSEAEAICRKAIDRFDERIDPSAYLTMIYHRQKKWNQVIKTAEQYLKALKDFYERQHSPNIRHVSTVGEKWKILFFLADANLSKGNIAHAMEIYDEAFSLSNEKTKCAKRFGARLFENKQYPEAKKVFMSACQDEETMKDLLVLEALFKTSLLTEDEGLKRRIIVDVLGLPLNSKDLYFLKDLGAYAFRHGDYGAGLIFFDFVSDIDPDDLDARLFKGNILVKNKDFEALIGECDELLRILNLPRNLTVNSLEDIRGIFEQIAERLIDTNNADAAKKAESIAKIIHAMV